MMRKLTTLLFLLIQGFALQCAPVQDIYTIYEVSFPNPHTHYVEVSIHFKGLPADSFEVIMPVWIPGSYMVREFSKNVEGFYAYNIQQQPVSFKKVRKNAWRIYNDSAATLSVRYRVYAFDLSVRTCFVDIDQAYLNGPALYMYADFLKERPLMVNFIPWKEWKTISTGLQSFGPAFWSRVAANYDELADCPTVLGNHDVFSFDYKGIPHHIAMVGNADYDREKIKSDFYKIVDECTAIFGENPVKEYTFIIHNTSHGGGGLEHSNSQSVMTARSSYEREKAYRGFLSLITHEYLHLWVVKRIRPLELGPFDYEKEVYTRQLWFFEGFTSFYDEYLLYRSGYYTKEEYLDLLVDNMIGVLNTPGDKIQSLSESSFDAWIKFYRKNENSRNAEVSYYSKGAMVGLLLHLDLINSTNGEKSLDDVLKYLYTEHYLKTGNGITDEELQQAFDTIGGKSYMDFFNRYIHGKERLPVEDFFAYAGLELQTVNTDNDSTGFLGVTFKPLGNRLIVSEVERGSAAWEQGLYVKDEIVGVDDKEPMQARDYLEDKKPGDVVTFRIARNGTMRDFSIVVGKSPSLKFTLSTMTEPTELQKMVLSKWLPR